VNDLSELLPFATCDNYYVYIIATSITFISTTIDTRLTGEEGQAGVLSSFLSQHIIALIGADTLTSCIARGDYSHIYIVIEDWVPLSHPPLS